MGIFLQALFYIGSFMTFATWSGITLTVNSMQGTIWKMSELVIEHLTVFQGFNLQQLRLLRPLFTFFYIPEGTVLFDQGETATDFFILVEGEVTIRYKPEDGPLIVVTRVHPEAVIGWSAAIGSPLYTSSAVCTTECKLLRVQSDSLRRLYHENQTTGVMLLERLAMMIEARLSSNHPQLMALLEQGLSIQLDQVAPAV